MKLALLLAAGVFSAAWSLDAAAPPPEKLLPKDTLLMVTVPDWDKAVAASRDFPMAQLWRDPAMKPLVDKFTERFKTELLTPLERELGVKFSSYTNLAHGQLTLALLQNGWKGESNKEPSVVFLLDVKDQAGQLKTALAELRKKWVDAGKTVKTEKIRDLEFATLIFSSDDLSKSFDNALGGKAKNPRAPAEPKKAPRKSELTIGQSGSLLLAGGAPADLEKILILQSGGTAPALADEPAFEANRAALFRNAQFYSWANFKLFNEIMEQVAAKENPREAQANPLMPKPGKLLESLGIKGVKTLAFFANTTPEGFTVNFFIGAPESARRGLFKILAPEARESAPPPFVQADVSKFNRWRLDGQKTWAALETLISELSPQLNGLLQMGLATAGKDRDQNFDLKKELIGNLGNDIITYQKAPRSAAPEDMSAPPALYLVGSASPEKLAQALRTGSSLLSQEPPKDRELLGKKIYSVKLPPRYNPKTGKMAENSFQFAVSGGYVAMSSDAAILEEFLRSNENTGRPLSEAPGLRDAAQFVGGMGTGWFGYENQSETLRVFLDGVKQNPALLDQMLSLPSNPLAPPDIGASKGFKDWIDVSLLPPFEKISKYFSFTVIAVSTSADGIHFKSFSPTPPKLKH